MNNLLTQVDAGLRFENRKQKYQYMFNVKTPKRIYYLVAENEAEMNKWVDAVCQVCGLKAYTQDEEQQSKRRRTGRSYARNVQPMGSKLSSFCHQWVVHTLFYVVRKRPELHGRLKLIKEQSLSSVGCIIFLGYVFFY